ncbi:hypothetical protein F5X96DRAFT_492910 [Biscogniauxia mediterranea]|nr:hypothetical protein F5X96DRAFT_492910 [Biscogniauxia mediterranea]
MFFAKATITAALLTAVRAHMVMTSPSPFNPKLLNNSPLDASGSDFPCKGSSTYSLTGGDTNEFALGSSQTLKFKGSAVHGGGSCQVVMTYDNPPTKDSVWKVIHSIEGGCPAKNQAENLPANPDLEDPYTYPYTIPDNIPTGKGTIGFTWFNRIGNREMYMNCGALELTGEGGDQSNFDSLPDMVVLNIGDHPTTPAGVDYIFADPGSSVENNIGEFGSTTCSNSGCGDSAGSGSGSGSGSSASASYPTATSSTSASYATTSAPAAASPTDSGAGGVFLTTSVATSAEQPTATEATSAPAATPTSGSSSGSASGETGACTTEGMFNCLGSSYQQCASGQWSAVMPLAAGTSCTAGQSTDLKIAAVSGRKRTVRAFRA